MALWLARCRLISQAEELHWLTDKRERIHMPYFHVHIKPKSGPIHGEWELDLTQDALVERFVRPYREGSHVGFNGKWVLDRRR